ncbi:MAG: plastocyanin/azurin family copper-binding protein [Pseudomonadota bacterium]
MSARLLIGAAAAFTAAALPSGLIIGLASAQQGDGHDAQVGGPATHHVDIHNFTFSPANLRVRPGDTIIWTNRDIAPHTATADDDTWDTGALRQNESASLVVTEDMHSSYYCRFHPMMTAVLEIAVER